jgi:hypothetical protein
LCTIDRLFKLAEVQSDLGLNCTLASGVTLGGVPLLARDHTGWTARPAIEITTLLKEAYGSRTSPENVSRGLNVAAQALNKGDLGRAMIATIQLRLPTLGRERAESLRFKAQRLLKYNPDEPRDAHGRWTTAGGSSSESKPLRNTPQTEENSSRILISNGKPSNDNFSGNACIVAAKQCQLTSLKDKSRGDYIPACLKAEDTCMIVLRASVRAPDQQFFVKFPDQTVVEIIDGDTFITHIGGVRLHPKGFVA